MTSSINKISSNNNYYSNYYAKMQNSATSYNEGKVLTTNNNDKSSDGKFSCSEAGKNFVKGLISPITGMFASPANFVTGLGMIAGSAVIIAVTGGAAAPLFVSAGLIMGSIQAGKAAHQFATAKNGDDFEKAFYDIGGATSTVGLSAIGAKSALRQASINTENVGVLNSLKTCFTSAKDLTIECYNVLKSGYYKTNLSNAIKVAKQPQSLRKYAQELHNQGEKDFEASFNALKDIFPDKLKPLITGRNKSQISIFEKMVKERTVTIDNAIEKIKNNPDLSDVVKKQEIAKLLTRKEKIATDSNYAKSLVEDRFGARLALDDVSEENMNLIVKHLVEAANRGDIEILEIENYRGYNPAYKTECKFYFSEEHLEALSATNPDMAIINKSKPSGYSAVQLKIRPKNGEFMELQIRGKEVDAFADIEHFPYDLRQNKDIAKGNNQMGICLSKVKDAITKLNKEQYKQYQQYIYDNYIYAQAKEFGHNAIKPTLPEGIDHILSVENLHILHEQTSKFTHDSVKNPFNIVPQLSMITEIGSWPES